MSPLPTTTDGTVRPFDLAVIGGGINGAGIAADAAGRGLRVLLVEQGDLAGATSSASSKLIHGGLRYLEHYDFRLVRESLAEREVLLQRAPHIIWPLRFVLPHVAGLRPRWMISLGLMLYDNLYRRRLIPSSRSLDLRTDPAGVPLSAELTRGFAYWDCWVDDARLVIANVQDAARRGAEIRVGTRLESGTRSAEGWKLRLIADNRFKEVTARAVVNAAGPWAGQVAAKLIGSTADRPSPRLRLVKGSHIVVPRISGATSAYLLQNGDGRVVFALPFEEHFTIIGTTDVPFDGDPADVAISDPEIAYLLELAGRFFARAPRREDIVWSYAGVRPLHDDASDNPSAVTRDWHLELDNSIPGAALLSVIGGKVTTYRRLAEAVLEHLAPHLPPMRAPWTAGAPLPGGEIASGNFEDYLLGLKGRWPGIDQVYLSRLARRYGSETERVLGNACRESDLGADLGGGIREREVRYLRDHEWARKPDDILWRRTKVGLRLSMAERKSAAERISAVLARAEA